MRSEAIELILESKPRPVGHLTVAHLGRTGKQSAGAM
jgi:hypothetical protein